jgi:hypothetical protein
MPILNDDTEMSRPSIPDWLMKDRIEMSLETESDDDVIMRATHPSEYEQREIGEGENAELAQFLD